MNEADGSMDEQGRVARDEPIRREPRAEPSQRDERSAADRPDVPPGSDDHPASGPRGPDPSDASKTADAPDDPPRLDPATERGPDAPPPDDEPPRPAPIAPDDPAAEPVVTPSAGDPASASGPTSPLGRTSDPDRRSDSGPMTEADSMSDAGPKAVADRRSRVPSAGAGDGPPDGTAAEGTWGGLQWPPGAREGFVALALLVIVLAGGYLRFLGLDWDDGQHVHPDERFLTMVEGALDLPQDWLGYLDTDTSPLNPRNRGHEFFVYGTWPITLVHFTATKLAERCQPSHAFGASGAPPDASDAPCAELPPWLRGGTSYGRVYLVGRAMSALLDTLGLLLLFAIGARLYGWRVGLLASGLIGFTAFHIQQSHFFTVDAMTTFFMLVFFLGAVGLLRRDSPYGGWPDTLLAGLGLGLSLASKISIWPLVPAVTLALAVRGYDAYREGLPEREVWTHYGGKLVLLGAVSFLFLRIGQPDMFVGPGWPNVVENPGRFAQVTSQLPQEGPDRSWWWTAREVMPDAVEPYLLPDPRWLANINTVRGQTTGHGTDWPPNHQWWNRIDYWFPWKNMVLWGMGLPLGLAGWLGWLFAGGLILRGDRRHLLPWLFIALLFAFQGGQWVKTMRYFLPLYPFLALLAAFMLVGLYDWTRRREERLGLALPARLRAYQGPPRAPAVALGLMALVVGGTVLWGYMFSRIYTRENTRVAGSRWIYHNVPSAFGLTVAAAEDGAGDRTPVIDAVYEPADYKGPGRFMPANHPIDVEYEGYQYTLREDDARLDRARVLVPTEDPVVIDGAHMAYLTDPAGDSAPETLRAWLGTDPGVEEDGTPREVVASGEVSVELDPDEPQHVRIPFEQTTLEPDGEYYLWLAVEGAPVSGRPATVAYDTSWDEIVPKGLDGYAAFDDANTRYGEGLYGSINLALFGEDMPDKVERLSDELAEADYIALSSNRVYDSVEQLPSRFPMTIELYEDLFDGDLGFEHVADVNSYPSLGPIEVPDVSAEEAFTVYDHSPVDVFRRTEAYDADDFVATYMPLTDERDWEWPSEEDDEGLLAGLLGLLGMAGDDEAAADAPAGEVRPPLESVMLSEEDWQRQQQRGTWSALFDADSLLNRYPWLAAVAWYLVLALLGVVAFPLVATALPNLADRGWALARTAGLLLVAWLAWIVAALELWPHTPALVWGAVGVVALAGLAVGWLRRRALWQWVREHRRTLLAEEALFLALFLVFLYIRAANPDLWHPWKGGEKPMDFAYLNATLRTVSFPPYDPWFAGGEMNYYYFGFVLVGALVELTRVVPWVAYNLAIPSLAAMTGLGVFGITFSAARALYRPWRVSAGAGALGAVLAVLSGNLYQVPFVLEKLASLAPGVESRIPGVERLVAALMGAAQVLRGQAEIPVGVMDWYWNASRAIPYVDGDTQPITEFPFFTFLYADLHAHMMALPLTVLALAVALSWALPTARQLAPGGVWRVRPWQLGRLALGALAVGVLWPANTWDYPTYGLVAAGGLAAGLWAVRRGPGVRWALGVGARGLVLLGLSLLLFWPYHAAYVTPYADFRPWDGFRTPLSAYIKVHGLFLFAVVTWAALRLRDTLAVAPERRRLVAAIALLAAGAAAVLYLWSQDSTLVHLPAPTPWTPALIAALLALGLGLLVQRGLQPVERFAAWLLALGVLATGFVEYVVLAGDIGRMNTVFKFYIQVWVLWSVLAAFAVAALWPRLRRAVWGPAWQVAMALLVAGGLTYTVTAARAKTEDIYPATQSYMTPEDVAAHEARPALTLDGTYFQRYGTFGEQGVPLHFRYDREAIRWLQENVEGTPVIAEGLTGNYHWGSRYSIYTGLPAIVGWDWHQKQQRNAVGGWVVDERRTDVEHLYSTPDADAAMEVLDRYDVRYVIVGELEAAMYPEAGLAKFERMADQGRLELVFENEGVRIYHVARPQTAEAP